MKLYDYTYGAYPDKEKLKTLEMFDEVVKIIAKFGDDVVRIADKYKADRDDLFAKAVSILGAMSDVGTFEHYEVK